MRGWIEAGHAHIAFEDAEAVGFAVMTQHFFDRGQAEKRLLETVLQQRAHGRRGSDLGNLARIGSPQNEPRNAGIDAALRRFEPVLARARQVLTVLEQRSAGTASSSQKASVLDDLPLFAHQPASRPVEKDPVHIALEATRPDEMTPKHAIEVLYQLKKIRDDARRS